MNTNSDCRWAVSLKESGSLSSSLGKIGLEVGSRRERTKDEKEDFCLRRFLEGFESYCPTIFPIQVYATRDRRELKRPDAVLVSGDCEVGLEIVEAGNSDYQNWMTKLEDGEFGECELVPDSESTDQGYRDVVAAIEKKIKKVREGAYRDTPVIDLLVYDNTSMLAFCDKQAVVSHLRKIAKQPSEFRRIHILFNSHIAFDVLGSQFALFPTNDLVEAAQ